MRKQTALTSGALGEVKWLACLSLQASLELKFDIVAGAVRNIDNRHTEFDNVVDNLHGRLALNRKSGSKNIVSTDNLIEALPQRINAEFAA